MKAGDYVGMSQLRSPAGDRQERRQRRLARRVDARLVEVAVAGARTMSQVLRRREGGRADYDRPPRTRRPHVWHFSECRWSDSNPAGWDQLGDEAARRTVA